MLAPLQAPRGSARAERSCPLYKLNSPWKGVTWITSLLLGRQDRCVVSKLWMPRSKLSKLFLSRTKWVIFLALQARWFLLQLLCFAIVAFKAAAWRSVSINLYFKKSVTGHSLQVPGLEFKSKGSKASESPLLCWPSVDSRFLSELPFPPLCWDERRSFALCQLKMHHVACLCWPTFNLLSISWGLEFSLAWLSARKPCPFLYST